MSAFDLHTAKTAPEGVREELAAVEAKFGFIPNIYGIFAESPPVAKAYLALTNLLATTSFSPAEQQLMLLTVSAVNGCEYCVAAHTMAGKMFKLDDTVIEAIRTGLPIPDARLATLHHFTKQLVEKRGWIDNHEIDKFLKAGFTRAQVLEVTLAISIKTMSNYINHMAETPLDEQFAPVAWQAPKAEVA